MVLFFWVENLRILTIYIGIFVLAFATCSIEVKKMGRFVFTKCSTVSCGQNMTI